MPDDTGLTNSSIDDIIKNYAASLPGDVAKERGAAANADTTAKENIETIKTNRKRSDDILSQMLKNKPPELDMSDIKQPEAPKYEADKPWESFGSAASVIGMFGGLLTRNPFVTSMNAATGAINSARQKKIEDFKQHVEAFKASSDHVSKLMQWRLDGYKSAMERYKGDQGALQAQLSAIASSTQDVPMIQALESGIAKNYHDVVADEVSALQKYNDSKFKIAELNERIKEAQSDPKKIIFQHFQKEFEEKNGRPPNAQEEAALERSLSPSVNNVTTNKLQGQSADLRAQAEALPEGDPQKAELLKKADAIDKGVSDTKTKETPNVISDKAAEFVADRILAGDPNATTNMTRNAANMTKIEDTLVRVAKERNIGGFDLMVARAGVRADQTSLNSLQKMTDAAVSFEKTAEKNFEYALTLMPKAVPDLGPWVNKWVETGATGVGDPNVPPYVAAMITGANEYAKIMAGSTGAQGSTVDSRREAVELFSPYLNTGQMKNVIKVARTDMGNRQKSLFEQVDSIKGRMRGETGSAAGGGAGPKEGDKSPSKSGKPMTFHGGQWEYD